MKMQSKLILNYTPTLDGLRSFSVKEYGLFPISARIPVGTHTPSSVFKKLKLLSKQCFILESAEDKDRYGRYTFLGYDPKLEITCKDDVLTIKSGATISIDTINPAVSIQKILDENKSPRFDWLPPYTGGLVGYFSYEYIRYMERDLNLTVNDEENFNDVDLVMFDKCIAFDHLQDEIILIANMRTDNIEENYHRAVSELSHMQNVIADGEPAQIEKLTIKSGFTPLFNKAQYCEMVERAKEYIKDGDIFQVVLSNRLEARADGSLFDTYRVLRETNPSPYMFYFSGDDIEIAGAAPETLVSVTNGVVKTFPLAGTRPRGADEASDRALEQSLLSDEKERAEHNMLVDLGRNDIGKISEFGSVKVDQYMTVLRFSHVMHLGSTVHAILKKDKTALDAIGALLPAGTLSGAPKIRACEIIDELEQKRRGIYGGAIGYLAFNGDMDTCIAIRIAFKKKGWLYMRSGAGIVADSIPENEFIECRNKLKAVTEALKTAEAMENE